MANWTHYNNIYRPYVYKKIHLFFRKQDIKGNVLPQIAYVHKLHIFEDEVIFHWTH